MNVSGNSSISGKNFNTTTRVFNTTKGLFNSTNQSDTSNSNKYVLTCPIEGGILNTAKPNQKLTLNTYIQTVLTKKNQTSV